MDTETLMKKTKQNYYLTSFESSDEVKLKINNQLVLYGDIQHKTS